MGDLCCHLGPCDAQISASSAEGHACALLKLGSVLMAVACVTTSAHGKDGPVDPGTGELVLTLA